MANETQHRPRLTPKGERTRARIVDAAARLIYERGVAGTTLDDVRATAEVSGSQLSHYFAGKDELVQAVIGHQAGIIVGNQEQADLGTTEGIKAWRDMVIAAARSTGGKGGCPLGSLGGQLAETDPGARALAAGGPCGGDDHVPPGLDALGSAEVGLFLVADDDSGLVADDRLYELVLAGEVVGELRAADLCGGPDVVERGAGHAPLVDQPGGGVHDPGAGPLALGRQPGPVLRLIRHDFMVSAFWV